MSTKNKSTKRFGARYGRKVKNRLADIESVRKSPKKCPYCHSYSVKRIATGIWYCKKCGSKFTGKAYNI